jgi:hypothetical protein
MAWDGQIEPVSVGVSMVTGRQTLLNVISHPLTSAIGFPNSTLSPHEHLLVFSAEFCQGFEC